MASDGITWKIGYVPRQRAMRRWQTMMNTHPDANERKNRPPPLKNKQIKWEQYDRRVKEKQYQHW